MAMATVIVPVVIGLVPFEHCFFQASYQSAHLQSVWTAWLKKEQVSVGRGTIESNLPVKERALRERGSRLIPLLSTLVPGRIESYRIDLYPDTA